MLSYGSSWVNKTASDFSVVDTSIQGANAVWDFTSLTPNNLTDDYVVYIVDPSTTPYSSYFPNANYGYLIVQGSSSSYYYFNLTNSIMERLGSYNAYAVTYSDPQIEYIFPLTLGASNNDTWQNDASALGGTYSLKCIGAGTLYLPSGTFNALLVRVHLTEGPISVYSYYWYSSDNGMILITDIPDYGVMRYLSSLHIGVEKNQLFNQCYYNSLVENNFDLSFQSKYSDNYSYKVMNAMGQEIYNGSFSTNEKQSGTLHIDFSNNTSGMYFLSIQSTKSNTSYEIIKIMKK